MTLLVALAALAAVTVLTVGFNLLLRANLRGDADRVLSARATAALASVKVEAGHVLAPETPDEGVPAPTVWIYDGVRPVESPRVSPRIDALAGQLVRDGGGYSESAADDLRLYAAPIRSAGPRAGTVVVALSIEPYERSANRALVGSALFAAVMLLLIVVLTRLVVNRALRPVAEMTSEAAEWSETDIEHRFNLGPPHDELTLLASTFDSLLSRLAANLRLEQRLTAEISHELRTPLAAIAAEAELALRRRRDDEQYRSALAGIQRRAAQLAEIIDTLLLAARSQALPDHESAAAAEVASAAIAAVPGEPAIELRNGAGTARVQAGVSAGSQILAPLLENARRYGAPPIRIDIGASGGELTFTVRDAGPGIPPADLERVFEPGVRGDGAEPTDGGAGLGLALSRRLARALGGDVVALPGPGGASLRAALPVAAKN